MSLAEKIAGEFSQQQAGSVPALRKEAFRAFEQLGIPGTRHEEWKYTNIKTKLPESISLLPAAAGAAPDFHKFSGATGNKLVFINGNFSKEHSTLLPQAGVTICSLAEAFKTHATLIENYYGKLVQFNEEHFAALNTAFATDGAFIYLERNAVVDSPVYLIHVFNSAESFVQSRNLLVLETGSNLQVIEDFQNVGSEAYSNHVTEVYVGANANINISHLQTGTVNTTAVHTIEADIQRDGRFTCNTITLEGKLIRNNTNARFKGENAEAHLNGLYFGKDSAILDNHLLVDHQVPNCQSNQLYKGILDDEATGVFNGKIFVKLDAQKTNAFQSSKAILLSDNAAINTKPQLEIFADDVKCSHGAAIGQLGGDEVFYLRSRGIPEKEARAMLTYAFANDIIQAITVEEVQTYLSALLQQRLNLTL